MPDIAVVINFDFPPAVGGQQGVESYVHRIGRTGRKGGTGRGKVRPPRPHSRTVARAALAALRPTAAWPHTVCMPCRCAVPAPRWSNVRVSLGHVP